MYENYKIWMGSYRSNLSVLIEVRGRERDRNGIGVLIKGDIGFICNVSCALMKRLEANSTNVNSYEFLILEMGVFAKFVYVFFSMVSLKIK